MKITALILTYNEAKRIRIALSHALKWADEVCVVDKSSTDDTREIASGMGAVVHTIPFSRQGHENMADLVKLAKNDWVWGFTPGEVPTKNLVQLAKAKVSDAVDCIIIPHMIYSFGDFSQFSPWSISGQPRLIHRKRVRFTGLAHAPIRAIRTDHVPYAQDCYVLHQTHVNSTAFIAAHQDYAANEVINGTPEEVLEKAMKNYVAHDELFSVDPAMKAQWLAWKIYWLTVALQSIEADRNRDVASEYADRAAKMLGDQWGELTAAPKPVRV
jgi:hypothetical protein